MKYIRGFESISEANEQVCFLPLLSGIIGIPKVLLGNETDGSDFIEDEAVCIVVDDENGFITIKRNDGLLYDDGQEILFDNGESIMVK